MRCSANIRCATKQRLYKLLVVAILLYGCHSHWLANTKRKKKAFKTNVWECCFESHTRSIKPVTLYGSWLLLSKDTMQEPLLTIVKQHARLSSLAMWPGMTLSNMKEWTSHSMQDLLATAQGGSKWWDLYLSRYFPQGPVLMEDYITTHLLVPLTGCRYVCKF